MGIPFIGDIIEGVTDLISEAIPDADKKREINLELARIEDAAEQRYHEQMIAQAEINKAEASNGSVFVAGWRPFVGWVCGVGLAAQVIAFPLIDRIWGWSMTFDTELLILTMTGMLGIGGMRTLEKIKGVSTNDYTDVPTSAPLAPKPKKKILGITLPEKAPWE